MGNGCCRARGGPIRAAWNFGGRCCTKQAILVGHPERRMAQQMQAYAQNKGTLVPGQSISVNKYTVQVDRYLSQGTPAL